MMFILLINALKIKVGIFRSFFLKQTTIDKILLRIPNIQKIMDITTIVLVSISFNL